MNFIKPVAYPGLSLLLAIISWSCVQNKNSSENVVDSTMAKSDSTIVQTNSEAIKKPVDPNVYEIPSDYPWLLKLIGERFPWDSASTCTRISAFDDLFAEASTTKDQVEDNLIAVYSYKDSYIKVAQFNIEEMQDCMDNICEVVLTSDWVPIGLGLHVGMTKSEFLEALSLDITLKQNTYLYLYQVDDYNSIRVVFEFKNEVMSFFSYEVTPCSSYTMSVPKQPFFTKLFNKPFLSMKPDSVQKLINTKVVIEVERNYETIVVDKISESEMYPIFKFDSSTIKFKKWPAWEIVYADLKSPQLSLINGIKVGMTRAAFLKTMCEQDFEGDEFHRGNRYCNDGFKSKNDLTVFFKEGIITEILYERWGCQ